MRKDSWSYLLFLLIPVTWFNKALRKRTISSFKFTFASLGLISCCVVLIRAFLFLEDFTFWLDQCIFNSIEFLQLRNLIDNWSTVYIFNGNWKWLYSETIGVVTNYWNKLWFQGHITFWWKQTRAFFFLYYLYILTINVVSSWQKSCSQKILHVILKKYNFLQISNFNAVSHLGYQKLPTHPWKHTIHLKSSGNELLAFRVTKASLSYWGILWTYTYFESLRVLTGFQKQD